MSVIPVQLQKELDEIDDEKLTRCDYFGFAPKCCQKLRKRSLVLFWVYWCVTTQSMLHTGFVKSSITTIERRYQLSSKESGAIVSSFEMGAIILVFPVSYYGSNSRRLRQYSVGMLLVAIGSFLFASPHFLSGAYVYEAERKPFCDPGSNSSIDICDTETAKYIADYRPIFWIAGTISGIGSIPVYTLGVSYIDDNLSKAHSALMIGIYYGCAVVGPATAYFLSSIFLGIFVNPGQKHDDITVSSVSWIGAWWIGFLITGVAAAIAVVPLFGFPKELPGTAKLRALKVSEAHGETEDESQALDMSHAHLLKNVKLTMCNPTFVFLTAAGSAEELLMQGLTTFGPKYLETVFGVSPQWSVRIIGIVVVPMGAFGILMGGLCIKWLEMNLCQILRVLLLVSLIVFPLLAIYIIPCGLVGEDVGWAGITVPYDNAPHSLDLEAACNKGCQCSKNRLHFLPLCGANRVTFFSPCFAGCSNETASSCRCLPTDLSNNATRRLSNGPCLRQCHNLAAFLAMFAVIMMLTFNLLAHGVSATLRCIPEKHKSLGLGIQSLLLRVTGSLPGPIIMGAAFDKSCVFWSSTCSGEGNCSVYDPRHLRMMILMIGLFCKSISTLSLFFAWYLYKPRFQCLGSASSNHDDFVLDSKRTEGEGEVGNGKELLAEKEESSKSS